MISIVGQKADDKAFIFTLKNPYGVEPTRYMNRKTNKYAIKCQFKYGPIFGNNDIHISNKCNRKDSCSIDNNGEKGYECHPQYMKSLFVNTSQLKRMNRFSVLDYEVYGINNYEENIIELCKHPDIIWEYCKTKDISEESLKQFGDDLELLSDLDAIHCKDSAIRVKISRYYLKNPSEFLPNTQLIDNRYDAKLREWAGDYKWKLLYRASEHGYTAKSFHEYCDDKGPTLAIIKSSGGWIFGGYTTKSWGGFGI